MSLLEVFVEVDDFYKTLEPWAASQQLPGRAGGSKRGPKAVMSAMLPVTFVANNLLSSTTHVANTFLRIVTHVRL